MSCKCLGQGALQRLKNLLIHIKLYFWQDQGFLLVCFTWEHSIENNWWIIEKRHQEQALFSFLQKLHEKLFALRTMLMNLIWLEVKRFREIDIFRLNNIIKILTCHCKRKRLNQLGVSYTCTSSFDDCPSSGEHKVYATNVTSVGIG